MRRAKVVLAIVVVVGAVVGLRAVMRDPANTEWADTVREDLVLTIEMEGNLRAIRTESVGPPQINDAWEFKISQMAPEGKLVQPGEPILAFDTSTLMQRLQDKQAEAAEARKQIEKLRTELGLDRSGDELKLSEARAKWRKASLKTDVPEDLEKGQVLEFAEMDRALAEQEIDYLSRRLEAKDASTRAALAQYRSQAQTAEERVRAIEQAIAAMTVGAPRAGTVVYIKNWRDEAKKVGDNCWRGEKVMELPDLTEMQGLAQVDEGDAGTLGVGQAARLRLDAHPDLEFGATVAEIHRTVQQKSWRNPVKVWKLTLALESTDPDKMRPGMRFRGEIETGRREDVLQIPLSAVVPDDAGPYVWRETSFGRERVRVSLGERNETHVEVIDGLAEGDRVATAPHRLEEEAA